MRKIIFSLLCLAAVSLFFGCSQETESLLISDEPASVSSGETTASLQSAKTVCVYICGAVKKPGVYELKPGSRIVDALKKAGGFAKDAARESLNLAETVSDGQMIRIATGKEIREASGGDSADASGPDSLAAPDSQADALDGAGKVNLNTADLTALMTLNGIGQAKAAQIISWREENGSFQSTEDLMKVPGIKQGTYDKLKDQITV